MSLKTRGIKPHNQARIALPVRPTQVMNGHVNELTMTTNNPYILFSKSLQQCRQLGARGGRAFARNQRLRRLACPRSVPESAAIPDDPALETAAQAIAMLDAQFPWLRGAEKHPGSRLLSLAHQTVGSAGRLGGFVRRDAA